MGSLKVAFVSNLARMEGLNVWAVVIPGRAVPVPKKTRSIDTAWRIVAHGRKQIHSDDSLWPYKSQLSFFYGHVKQKTKNYDLFAIDKHRPNTRGK